MPPAVILKHYDHPAPFITLQIQGTWNRPSVYPSAAGAAAVSSSRENGTERESSLISRADNEPVQYEKRLNFLAAYCLFKEHVKVKLAAHTWLSSSWDPSERRLQGQKRMKIRSQTYTCR